MASTLIGSLRVALGLDTAQFEAGAAKSRSVVRGLTKDIESSFKSAKVAVEGLVAAFAVGALTNQIQQSLKYAAAIGETASTLGVTTKQLQQYRFAAQQVGVAQESLEGGLARLTVSIGKAEVGSQAQIKAFNAIGISVDQLRGKNTGQVFELIADRLKNVTDRSQRAAIEVALLGRQGASLDSLLSGGVNRLNALGEAAQQLGVVLSDQQIQNAEVTAHKLEALKTVLEANIASVVTSNANSILSLAQALSTLTNEILHFFSSNPQLALGIIGGLAGSRFGVAGAAIGAAGGALLGNRVAENAADQNMDLRFRIQQLRNAQAEYNSRKAASEDTGSILSFRHGSGKGGTVQSAFEEWKKQKALLDQATAAALQPKPPPLPSVNLPKFLAPDPRKGRKPPADRSDELLAQMDKEILQADQNILQAKLGLAGSNEDRLRIAVQLVQIEKTVQDKAVDEEVAKAKRDLAEHKITATAYQEVLVKAQALKNANAIEAQTKLRAIVEEQAQRAETANFQIAEQQLQFKQDALHTADQLATTAEDHRRIQLEILDLEIEQKRLQLEKNLLDAKRNGATAEEIRAIQDAIDHLPAERAQGAVLIDRNNQTPLEAYFQGLPHTAAEVNQALQSIEVNGIQGLSGALAQAGKGWGAMRDSAIQALQDIEQQLIQLGLNRLLFSLFGNAVLGGGGGLGASIYPVVGGVDPLAPLANGGSFTVGGIGGVDRNVLSINGRPRAKVSADETIMVVPRRLPGMKSGGLLGALSFLSPALFLQQHQLLKYLSPAAFMIDKMHDHGAMGALRFLSPAALAADKLFGGKGHTFNINVNAPNTGNPMRDRQTSLQQAADVRHAIAGAVSKGLM